MALNVVWSQTALNDADAIAAFIYRDSPFYAKAVLEKLFSSTQLIAQFPQLGRIVPELNQPDIRERLVYSYRLIDAVKSNQIEILTVVHGRRLLELAE